MICEYVTISDETTLYLSLKLNYSGNAQTIKKTFKRRYKMLNEYFVMSHGWTVSLTDITPEATQFHFKCK